MSRVELNSGAGLTCSRASVITSETPSTTIPTTRPAHLGDEIYAILTLMDEPNKVPIPGKVCWVTPAGVPGRQQGIGIQFAKNEAGEQARIKIENLLSGALKSARPTHTI